MMERTLLALVMVTPVTAMVVELGVSELGVWEELFVQPARQNIEANTKTLRTDLFFIILYPFEKTEKV